MRCLREGMGGGLSRLLRHDRMPRLRPHDARAASDRAARGRAARAVGSLTRMRFRTDSASRAEDRARMERGKKLLWSKPEDLEGIEPARPGDTWRVRWKQTIDKEPEPGPLAGYAICCPKCKAVHWWTEANNCAGRKPGSRCIHHGVGSCWRWSGSAEQNQLTATPSLWANGPGGCGWHGHLTNGVMIG